MTTRISKTLKAWKEQVELKNAYTFGYEELSLTEFSDLFKNTFEIVKTARNDFICKNIVPENKYVALEYLELLTTLSEYAADCFVGDESENKAFYATCLIAQKLIFYATNDFNYGITEDGKITFFGYDYTISSDDEEFVFDIYEGKFDEIIEFASRLGI